MTPIDLYRELGGDPATLAMLAPKPWGWAQRSFRVGRRALAALQGVCAMTPDVPIEWLAALAADGSDASIDGLIPHIARALDRRDAYLDQLRTLESHAADTPRMRELVAELVAAHDARSAVSPALGLAPIIGLDPVDRLWFTGYLRSTRPRIGVAIRVDSHAYDWFRVKLDAPDSFEPAEPATLPQWLGRAAVHVGVAWTMLVSFMASVHGAQRETLLTWLNSKR